jgi:hypothetical protein
MGEVATAEAIMHIVAVAEVLELVAVYIVKRTFFLPQLRPLVWRMTEAVGRAPVKT